MKTSAVARILADCFSDEDGAGFTWKIQLVGNSITLEVNPLHVNRDLGTLVCEVDGYRNEIIDCESIMRIFIEW